MWEGPAGAFKGNRSLGTSLSNYSRAKFIRSREYQTCNVRRPHTLNWKTGGSWFDTLLQSMYFARVG